MSNGWPEATMFPMRTEPDPAFLCCDDSSGELAEDVLYTHCIPRLAQLEQVGWV